MEDTGRAQNPGEMGVRGCWEVSPGGRGVLGEGKEEWGTFSLPTPSYVTSRVPGTHFHHVAISPLHLRRPREAPPAGRRPSSPFQGRAPCGGRAGPAVAIERGAEGRCMDLGADWGVEGTCVG